MQLALSVYTIPGGFAISDTDEKTAARPAERRQPHPSGGMLRRFGRFPSPGADGPVCSRPAPDAAQTGVGKAQQPVHLPGGVFVNTVLVVDQNVIGLPDLPRRLRTERPHRRGQRKHKENSGHEVGREHIELDADPQPNSPPSTRRAFSYLDFPFMCQPPDLRLRRLFPRSPLWHEPDKKGTDFFHPLDFVSLSLSFD